MSLFFCGIFGLFWAFPHSRTGLLRYKIAPQFFRSDKSICPHCVQMLLSEPHASRRLQFLTLQARRQAFSRRLRSLPATSCCLIGLFARARFASNPDVFKQKKNIEIIDVLSVRIYSFGQTGFGVAVASIPCWLLSRRLRSLPATSCCLIGLFARARFASNPDAFRQKKNIEIINVLSVKINSFGQTGFEPATSTSRTSRATSCAIAR